MTIEHDVCYVLWRLWFACQSTSVYKVIAMIFGKDNNNFVLGNGWKLVLLHYGNGLAIFEKSTDKNSISFVR